jgi:hypothetical protein
VMSASPSAWCVRTTGTPNRSAREGRRGDSRGRFPLRSTSAREVDHVEATHGAP